MKTISTLALLGTLLGFNAPWMLRSKIETAVQAQNVQNLVEEKPSRILVEEEISLDELIPGFVSADVERELNLYPEYNTLQSGDQLEIEYSESDAVLRMVIRRSKYERLRIEMDPTPSIVLDVYPLDARSLVFSFSKEQLFAPNQDLLDIYDAEPGLLGVIDNQIDVVKGLEEDDSIEILAVGRYRGENLERLESVLSVRINQEESSSLLFKYTDDEYSTWYSDDLSPCSFPFLQTPTNHILVSSWFGEKRGSKTHKAIDFAAPIGRPIYASADGVISKAGWGTGYGMMAIIEHEQLGNYESLYAHMSRSYVKLGQEVRQGEIIGLVGNTGRSTGPHLHYEIRENGHKINPRSKSLHRKFQKQAVDPLVLSSFRDQVDEIFVQATTTVVDVSSLLVSNDI